MRAQLSWSAGLTGRKTISLQPGQTYRIGRSPDAEIVVPDPKVTRYHCELQAHPDGGWVVNDLGSTNGTSVNGQRISSHRLRDGDTITAGGTAFEFMLKLGDTGRPAPEKKPEPLRPRVRPPIRPRRTGRTRPLAPAAGGARPAAVQLCLDFLAFRFGIAQYFMSAIWALLSALTLLMFAIGRAGGQDAILVAETPLWIDVAWLLLILAIVRVVCESLALPHTINNSTGDVARSLGLGGGGGSQGRRSGAGATFDVLTLRSLVLVYLVEASWIVGSIWIAFGEEPADLSSTVGESVHTHALARLAALVVWRLVCESIVAIFRISETMTELRRMYPSRAGSFSLDAFFRLDWLVTPWLVRGLWLGGVPTIIYLTIEHPGLLPTIGPPEWRIPNLVIGILALRLACEFLIVFYTWYESVQSLETAIARRSGRSAGADSSIPPGPWGFRRMISPGLIVALWVVGSILILLSPVEMRSIMQLTPLECVPLVVGGLIALRLACECLIVAFRINRALGAAALVAGPSDAADGPAPGARLVDVLTLRSTLTTLILQILWVLTVAGYFCCCIVVIAAGADIKTLPGAQAPAGLLPSGDGPAMVVVGLAALTILLIVTRILFEFDIVFFSINKILKWLRRALRGAGGAGPDEPGPGALRRERAAGMFQALAICAVAFASLAWVGAHVVPGNPERAVPLPSILTDPGSPLRDPLKELERAREKAREAFERRPEPPPAERSKG